MLLSGDISYQLYVKERQQCKPFSYFMEVVAPGNDFDSTFDSSSVQVVFLLLFFSRHAR
jgi:hypothetical protein